MLALSFFAVSLAQSRFFGLFRISLCACLTCLHAHTHVYQLLSFNAVLAWKTTFVLLGLNPTLVELLSQLLDPQRHTSLPSLLAPCTWSGLSRRTLSDSVDPSFLKFCLLEQLLRPVGLVLLIPQRLDLRCPITMVVDALIHGYLDAECFFGHLGIHEGLNKSEYFRAPLSPLHGHLHSKDTGTSMMCSKNAP